MNFNTLQNGFKHREASHVSSTITDWTHYNREPIQPIMSMLTPRYILYPLYILLLINLPIQWVKQHLPRWWICDIFGWDLGLIILMGLYCIQCSSRSVGSGTKPSIHSATVLLNIYSRSVKDIGISWLLIIISPSPYWSLSWASLHCQSDATHKLEEQHLISLSYWHDVHNDVSLLGSHCP